MKILLFDNYDSFTYNLYHYVSQFSDFVDVKRENQIVLDEISKYDRVIFSPGPGVPQEHPVMLKIINEYSGDIPMLGICLGYQAIAMHFGARLSNLDKVKHGVSSKISILSNKYLFSGLPKIINVAHYHSWIIDESTFPRCLTITSRSEDGFITSYVHKKFNITGVQFHPESILTEHGLHIIKNWISI